MITRCLTCGAPLPPYPGRGKPRQRCAVPCAKDRQRERVYHAVAAYRARKRAERLTPTQEPTP